MFIKNIKKTLPIILIISLSGLTISQAGTNRGLTLSIYLDQVRTYNLGVAGSYLIGSGAKERVGEGKLIMKPSLFAEGQYLKDSYNPNWSPIIGDSSSLQSYKLGISENTPFGLQGKIYYNYQRQTVNGPSLLVNRSQLTASSPIAELDLPLSRNLGGRETRAEARLIDSEARLTDASQRYTISTLLAQAESTYWRLAVARCIVIKRQESLDRAIKIKQWVANRTRSRLAEDADLLQAEAALESNNLNLQAAINDQILAEHDFNTLRGFQQRDVSERLLSFDNHITARLNLPLKPGIREDVLIAEQEKNIKIANAQLGIEKNKPDINLYASYALNGNNPSSNQAISESFTANYPSTAVGLRLSIPLDMYQMNKDRAAYKKGIAGAKCQFKQKVYENSRLLENITIKIQNAQRRLEVASLLEQIQNKKLQVERQRLTYGKTTTFQVLLFEQDYANAQVARLVIQDEILELMAQLKTFGV